MERSRCSAGASGACAALDGREVRALPANRARVSGARERGLKMKSFRFAALLSVLVAARTTGAPTATWTLLTPVPVPSVIQGDPVPWAASVAVTNDCKGLASYSFNVEVRDSRGVLTIAYLAPANFTPTFRVNGLGPASVRQINTAGGPGLDDPNGDEQEPGLGLIRGINAAYSAPWVAPRYTYGVGQPARAAALGVTGPYVLNDGLILTDGLTFGTYTVRLTVNSCSVLRTYDGATSALINYDTTLTSLPTESCIGIGDEFKFYIPIPEPATALLVAGAGLCIRRRRGA